MAAQRGREGIDRGLAVARASPQGGDEAGDSRRDDRLGSRLPAQQEEQAAPIEEKPEV